MRNACFVDFGQDVGLRCGVLYFDDVFAGGCARELLDVMEGGDGGGERRKRKGNGSDDSSEEVHCDRQQRGEQAKLDESLRAEETGRQPLYLPTR